MLSALCRRPASQLPAPVLSRLRIRLCFKCLRRLCADQSRSWLELCFRIVRKKEINHFQASPPTHAHMHGPHPRAMIRNVTAHILDDHGPREVVEQELDNRWCYTSLRREVKGKLAL